MRKFLEIARYEFSRNVRRISYVVFTLSVPFIGLIAIAVGRTASPLSTPSEARTPNIGYVDLGDVLRLTAPVAGFTRYSSSDSARRALVDGRVDHVFVVPPDYRRSGQIQLYNRQFSYIGQGATTESIREFLGIALAGGALPRQTVTEILRPPSFTLYQVGARGSVQSERTTARRLIVANLFTLLLAISIFSAAQFLLQGVTEEKENRVIEVLLSSVSAEQLMGAKILGLGALGLLQIAIWTVTTRLFAVFAPSGLRDLTSVSAAPGTLALLFLLFLLGYLLFAGLMASIGGIASSMREGQQMAALLATLALVPVYFSGALVNSPNGVLARAFSIFPFTASTTLMLRLPTTEVSPVELAGELILLVLCVALMILAAMRIFRAGILLSGKRLGPGAVVAALRGG